MAMSINTNVMALNAQRNLSATQNDLSTAMERLSSGLRINSAKDDAAGLAISDRMTSQIRGLNQAVRNAGDGISMAQTAEGAMQEMTNILQRMREISVQAVNDTNTQADRLALQDEMDQMYAELDRIAETTQFNGKNILDGTAGESTFQIGANSGQTLAVTIDSVTTQSLNLNGFSAEGEMQTGREAGGVSVAADDVLINGENAFAGTLDLSGGNVDDAAALADAINANSGNTGVSANAYNTVTGNSVADGITLQARLTVNGTAVDVQAGSASDFVDLVNRDVGGITATLNTDNSITLSNDTGNDITVGAYNGTTASNIGISQTTYAGYVGLTSNDGTEITVAANTEASGNTADVQSLGLNVSDGTDEISGTTVSANALTTSMDIAINGTQVGTSSTGSAADKAAAINAIEDQTNVEATAYNEVTVGLDIEAISSDDVLRINGTEIFLDSNGSTFGGTAFDDMADVVNAINTSGLNGVVAETNDDGLLVLKSDQGLDISVAGSQDVLTSLTDIEGANITMSDSGEDTQTSKITTGYSAPTNAVTYIFNDDAGLSATITAGADATTAAGILDGVAGFSASVTESGNIEISADDGSQFTLDLTSGVEDPLDLVAQQTTTLGALTPAASNAETLEFSVDGGAAISVALHDGANPYSLDEVAANINTAMNTYGVEAVVNGAAIDIVNYNTENTILVDSAGAGAPFAGLVGDDGVANGGLTVTAGTAAAGATSSGKNIFEGDADATGRITLESTNGGDVRVGGADVDELGLVEQGGSEDVIGAGLSVTSAENASTAIERIDEALAQIDSSRSELGAVQNRFESTIANLQNVSQNLSDARSRIMDADFAQETTNMSRAQILSQAGTSMLAQANASQQNVLSLLG